MARTTPIRDVAAPILPRRKKKEKTFSPTNCLQNFNSKIPYTPFAEVLLETSMCLCKLPLFVIIFGKYSRKIYEFN